MNTSSPRPGSPARPLLHSLDGLLQPAAFKDYGPNGLQVEGRAEIRKVVSGVTASLALIDAAIEAGADALLVHHGLFWRGQDGRVTGWMKQRLSRLLAHDINLFAYHLPLDAHATSGQQRAIGQATWASTWLMAQRLGLESSRWGSWGAAPCPVRPRWPRMCSLYWGALSRWWPSPIGRLSELRLCTGGAQSYFEGAIAAGADVFITGEISEPQAHYARECGVAYIACGHHASERYGAPAVGAHVAAQLGMAHQFIDMANPA